MRVMLVSCTSERREVAPAENRRLVTAAPPRSWRFKEAQSTAARAVIVAWQSGVKHRIRLAKVAIRAVEQNEPDSAELAVFIWNK
jgi:hypothetical protein